MMHCTEESTWDVVDTFRRPPVIRHRGKCAPLATPLGLVYTRFCTLFGVSQVIYGAYLLLRDFDAFLTHQLERSP